MEEGVTERPLLLTVQTAADRLSVSKSTIWRLIRAGRLQTRVIGRSATRVLAASLADYVGSSGPRRDW